MTLDCFCGVVAFCCSSMMTPFSFNDAGMMIGLLMLSSLLCLLYVLIVHVSAAPHLQKQDSRKCLSEAAAALVAAILIISSLLAASNLDIGLWLLYYS